MHSFKEPQVPITKPYNPSDWTAFDTFSYDDTEVNTAKWESCFRNHLVITSHF